MVSNLNIDVKDYVDIELILEDKKCEKFAVFEWLFKQLICHSFTNIYDKCFEMVMAFEYNRPYRTVLHLLVNEKKRAVIEENVCHLKVIFDWDHIHYAEIFSPFFFNFFSFKYTES